jgi:[ribosomal protein S5]-alanine N-acetyltransferase
MPHALYDFSMFPTLTTERLLLRQPTRDDAPAFVSIFGRPEAMTFLNVPPLDTLEKAVAMIDQVNGRFNSKSSVEWVIVRQADGQVIGLCDLFLWIRSDRKADVGYHIAPAEWGNGYATEATHAMIAWSFAHMNLHRIQADITEGNIASERVLLKCGFTVEGIWRESCWEHERFVNIKQFGLLRREYEAR